MSNARNLATADEEGEPVTTTYPEHYVNVLSSSPEDPAFAEYLKKAIN